MLAGIRPNPLPTPADRALGANQTKLPAGIMEAMSSKGAGKTQIVERVLLVMGLSLLLGWAAARFHGSTASDTAVQRFYADAVQGHGTPSAAEVDFTQWSPKRATRIRG